MCTKTRRLLLTGVAALALATVTACGDEPPDIVPGDSTCVVTESVACGAPEPGPSEETYPPESFPPESFPPDDPTAPWEPTDPYVPDDSGSAGGETGCAYWGEIGCGDDTTITLPPLDLDPWS
ncbi:hypothetical protein ACFU53_26990 [Streptomyces sp. NPDC057474]|uniref:hypothetical protein n=1 Tax=Streptomyces sp. NPDC057474 TaxID=3346144 RepID=UPI003686AF41